MKALLTTLFIIAAWFSVSIIASAQSASAPQPVGEDPRHNELRAVLAGLQSAINEMDIEKLKTYLDPNVNVVYQNAEVADGVAAVDAFYRRMFLGDSPVLEGYRTEVSVEQLSEFYGDTAVAYGTISDTITYFGGKSITLPSRWTATLVRSTEGEWKIVSVQFGANVFENPLLEASRMMSIIAGVGGLLLGLLGGWLIARRRTASA